MAKGVFAAFIDTGRVVNAALENCAIISDFSLFRKDLPGR